MFTWTDCNSVLATALLMEMSVSLSTTVQLLGELLGNVVQTFTFSFVPLHIFTQQKLIFLH